MIKTFEGTLKVSDSWGSVARLLPAGDFEAINYDESLITDKAGAVYYVPRDGEAVQLWAAPLELPARVLGWGHLLDFMPAGSNRASYESIKALQPSALNKLAAMQERAQAPKNWTASEHLAHSERLKEHGSIYFTAEDARYLTGFDLGIVGGVLITRRGKGGLIVAGIKGANISTVHKLKIIVRAQCVATN